MCGNEGGLIQHKKAKHNVKHIEPPPLPPTRKSYSIKRKSFCLNFVFMALTIMCGSCANFEPARGTIPVKGKQYRNRCSCGDATCFSEYATVKDACSDRKVRVKESTFCKWKKKSEFFTAYGYTSLRSLKKVGTGRKVLFPEAEEELYENFLYERKVSGLPIDSYWLRAEMHRILGNTNNILLHKHTYINLQVLKPARFNSAMDGCQTFAHAMV